MSSTWWWRATASPTFYHTKPTWRYFWNNVLKMNFCSLKFSLSISSLISPFIQVFAAKFNRDCISLERVFFFLSFFCPSQSCMCVFGFDSLQASSLQVLTWFLPKCRSKCSARMKPAWSDNIIVQLSLRVKWCVSATLAMTLLWVLSINLFHKICNQTKCLHIHHSSIRTWTKQLCGCAETLSSRAASGPAKAMKRFLCFFWRLFKM